MLTTWQLLIQPWEILHRHQTHASNGVRSNQTLLSEKAAVFDTHVYKSERCTNFFLKSSFFRGTRIPTDEDKRADNTIKSDPEEVSFIHCTCWSRIFSSNGNGLEHPPNPSDRLPLLEHIRHVLSDEDRSNMKYSLSAVKIARTLLCMAKHKSPGPDGLRFEVFYMNVHKWAQTLATMFETFVHSQNYFAGPLETAIIVLLYKNGDPTSTENYSPISLLNTVAQFLRKTFSFPLKKLMPKLKPTVQTGIGRSITENLISLQDALHWSRTRALSTVLVSLEFAKAYEKVQKPYLYAVLRYLCLAHVGSPLSRCYLLEELPD